MNRASQIIAAEERRPVQPPPHVPAAATAHAPPPAVALGDPRPFFLVSEHNDKCVLDIRKDNPKPGALVGVFKRKTPVAPNQLWYIGDDGFIRSKLNDLVLSADGNNKDVKMATVTGDARQNWILEGNKIINKVFVDSCITIKKGLVRIKDDAEVIAAKYEGADIQHWKRVYNE